MSTRPSLRGVLVPITTPFDAVTGDPAPVPLRAHVRELLDGGVHGVLVAGSTGEAALLTDEEFRQVVGWVRDVVPADRALLVGTGRESTRATVAACRTAGELGADAVLVRAPSYYGSSLGPAALVEHLRRIADGSPVPVVLYNIPKYTHVALPDQMLAALATHENVVGAKDSSGDLKNFAAYTAAVPAWAHFIGSATLFYSALELGAVGGILGIANVAPALALEVWDRWEAGDRAGAGAVQERLGPLNKLVVGELGVPGVKAAMDLVGRPGGPVRAPLAELGGRDRARVAAALREAGALRDSRNPA
jgi:dihydrodipicolinate synthase/N-acetylneuraminate lyase